MMILLQLAQKYNIAVVVTNQATIVPDSTLDKDESCKPYGGNVMGHATSYGIHLCRIVRDRDFSCSTSQKLLPSMGRDNIHDKKARDFGLEKSIDIGAKQTY